MNGYSIITIYNSSVKVFPTLCIYSVVATKLCTVFPKIKNYLHLMCHDLKPVPQFTTAVIRYCCLLNKAFKFTHHPVISEQMHVLRVSGSNTLISFAYLVQIHM
jgi:hypothetical protein